MQCLVFLKTPEIDRFDTIFGKVGKVRQTNNNYKRKIKLRSGNAVYSYRIIFGVKLGHIPIFIAENKILQTNYFQKNS